MDDQEFRPDPENFEKMSVPFAGTESAGVALEAFREEFFELRKKHHIMNAVFIVEVPCLMGSEEHRIRTQGCCGDAMREMELLLWAAQQAHTKSIEMMVNVVASAKEESQS